VLKTVLTDTLEIAYEEGGQADGLKLSPTILVGYDWGARAACTVLLFGLPRS
jgi:hypothetical protein